MKVLRITFLSGFTLEFAASLSVALVAVSIGLRLVAGDMTLVAGLFVLVLAPEVFLPLRNVGAAFHSSAAGVTASTDAFDLLAAARESRGDRAVGALDAAAHDSTLVSASAAGRVGDGLVIEGLTRSPGRSDRARRLRPRRASRVRSSRSPARAVRASRACSRRCSASPTLRAASRSTAAASSAGDRSAIAWAGQTPSLLAGTIASNVRLGDEDAAPALLARALELAGVELDPDRVLGPAGAGLSGGQAQRVATARAIHRLLARDARLLLLDEPASAQDADREAQLARRLRELAAEGRIVLVTTHRSGARRDRRPRASTWRWRMSDRTTAVLRGAVPRFSRLLPSILFGIGSAGSSIALLACFGVADRARRRAAARALPRRLGIVGVRAFALGRAVFRYLERLTGHDASFRQLATIRAGVFERMLPIAPDGLAASRRGDLLARFVDDVDELQNVPLRVVQPVVSAAIVLVLAVVGIAFLAPESAWAVLVCLVVGIGATLLVQRRAAGRAERTLAPLRGELQAAIVEHVQSLDVLVAFDAAEAGRRRIDAVGARLATATRARAVATGAASAATIADRRIRRGGEPRGRGAAARVRPHRRADLRRAVPRAARDRRGRRRRSRSRRVRCVSRGRAPSASRVPCPTTCRRASRCRRSSPKRLRRDIRRPRSSCVASARTGRTSADDDDRVAHARPAALEGVDLEIAPGERLLVRGASGAGKTTLAHVLVRFLDYEGSYRIGGVEASTSMPANSARLVGLVEQRPWLFDEDVRQNLLFARDTATDDDLLDGARPRRPAASGSRSAAGSTPRWGSAAALVSGGQAQRIALARAMLADFPVLVLDEPTASVDPARADALLRDLTDAASRRAAPWCSSHTRVWTSGSSTGWSRSTPVAS